MNENEFRQMFGWMENNPTWSREFTAINTMRLELVDLRSKFNEIDLCHMGQAPCAVLLDTYRQLDEARAALKEADEWMSSLNSPVGYYERHAAALKAAREAK